MYTTSKPLFLICETPLHAGSGSDLGIVDLPIQRERHTSFPKIEGSSLKGSLRERFEQVLEIQKNNSNRNNVFYTFGPDSEIADENSYAGALGFTDARLLLFPVKSMKGVFAWITCPGVLKKFWQDMQSACIKLEFEVPSSGTVTKNSNLFFKQSSDKIILEEYTFSVQKDDLTSELGNWLVNHLFPNQESTHSYWQQKMAQDLVVLPDDDFKDFVNLSTEVITRTKIDNQTGTVQDGALFTEEYLPAESVLYALVLASPVFPGDNGSPHKLSDKYDKSDGKAVIDFFSDTLRDNCHHRIQVGGNATLGKGIIHTTIISNNNNSQHGK